MIKRHIRITQGEYVASADVRVVISTLLGSCVSCCIWDPSQGVGGMNHMLLASRASEIQKNASVHVNEMELLINEVIKLGANRHNLRAKAFGGAQMLSGLPDVGPQNADFTLAFLEREGIKCESHSLGGRISRLIKFWPATGRVLQKVSPVLVDESIISKPASQGNDAEFF